MVFQATHMTVEEFDRFAMLPQNADKLLEYIGVDGDVLPGFALAVKDIFPE